MCMLNYNDGDTRDCSCLASCIWDLARRLSCDAWPWFGPRPLRHGLRWCQVVGSRLSGVVAGAGCAGYVVVGVAGSGHLGLR